MKTVADRIEALRADYNAPLVMVAKPDHLYDIGVTFGGELKFLCNDVGEDFADTFLGGLEAGFSISKVLAPAATVPKVWTALIAKGQSEVVVAGPKGLALMVEGYLAKEPYSQVMDVNWDRTNGGDVRVFFVSPANFDVMVRVLEL